MKQVSDRIVILDRGRKVAEGTLDELRRHPSVQRTGGASLRFPAGGDALRAQALLQQNGVASVLEEHVPGLERIFLDLTGRELRDQEEA